VNNNPIRYNDPSGHSPEGRCGGGGGCDKNPYVYTPPRNPPATISVSTPRTDEENVYDYHPSSPTIIPGNVSQPSADKNNSDPFIGVGFEESQDDELYLSGNFWTGYWRVGTVTSQSVSTNGRLVILANAKQGKISGIGFDTDLFFGDISLDKEITMGMRTPAYGDQLFKPIGISRHIATSVSVDLSKGISNPEMTVSLYHTDLIEQNGAFTSEVMAGYYYTSSLKQNYIDAGIKLGAIAAGVYAIELITTAVVTCSASGACRPIPAFGR
jgi:hypothetical protein